MGELELNEEIESAAMTMLSDCGVTGIEAGWSPMVQFVANVSATVHRVINGQDARIQALEEELETWKDAVRRERIKTDVEAAYGVEDG